MIAMFADHEKAGFTMRKTILAVLAAGATLAMTALPAQAVDTPTDNVPAVDNTRKSVREVLTDLAGNNPGVRLTSRDNGLLVELYHPASNRCVAATGHEDGDPVLPGPCRGPESRLLFTTPESASSQIVLEHTGKCLDIPDASTENGAVLQQWTCDEVDNQYFFAVGFDNGMAVIPAHVDDNNLRKAKCLEITGPHRPIVQSTCVGNRETAVGKTKLFDPRPLG